MKMSSSLLVIVALFYLALTNYGYLADDTEDCSGLRCDDGVCISREKWCDKAEDCWDESDEKYCKKKSYFGSADPNKCNKTHFLCDDGICFPRHAKCDGVNDCSDGEDENECPDEEVTTVSSRIIATKKIIDQEETKFEPVFQPHSEFLFESSSSPSVSRGVKWLLTNRKKDYSWGKDTARAFVALGLVNPGVFLGETGALMKKQFQVHVAVDLLRNQTKPINLSKLSQYINAMLATCQNPRNFHGVDLVHILRSRISASKSRSRNHDNFINPLVYLTLCLANSNATHLDLDNLLHLLRPVSNEQKWEDMQSLAIMALSCFMRNNHDVQLRYKEHQKVSLDSLLLRLDSRDGSFGNLYSTALSVQALISANREHDSKSSLKYLESQQKENGSFGDLLGTYYVLPTLAGKSLLHLQDVNCPVSTAPTGLTPLSSLINWIGPRYYIRYSLLLGKPVDVSYSIMLHVPVNISFFDIMRLAEQADPKFKFLYERDGDAINIYSISNVPNDAERGIYWNLYVNHNAHHDRYERERYRRHHQQTSNENAKPYTRGVQYLVPTNGDHISFWYHPM